MPNLTDIAPLSVTPQTETNRQLNAARQEADPSFSELGTAALLQGPVASVFNYVARDPILWPAETGFSLSPNDQLFKELTDGVDPAYWPQFADATSTQHAYYIRNLALNRQKYRDQLGAAGVSGTAASIVAGLVDPVNLAIGVASGGLGVASATTRAGQLARSGLIAGGAFSGVEAFKRSQDPVITPGEVALAGVSGALGTVAGEASQGLSRGARFFTTGAAQAAPIAAYDVLTDTDRQDIALNVLPQFFLGGVLGMMGPRDHAVKVDQIARNAVKSVELEIAKESGATLTPKGEQYFKPVDHLTDHEKFSLAMGDWSPFNEALGIDPSKPETMKVWVPKPVEQSFKDLIGDTSGPSDFERLLQDGSIPSAIPERQLVEVEVPFRKSELEFGDIMRIVDQAENDSGVVVPHGQDITTEAPTSRVSSDETPGHAVGAAAPTDPAFRFAAKRVEKINEQVGDLNLNNVGDESASYKRWSAAGMASRAEIPDVARAANMLGIDHVPKQGSGLTYYTAADAAESWHHANMAKLFKANDAAFDAYTKAEKAAGREPMKPLQFFEAATDAYESGLPSGNEHIDRVVENVRAIRKADWERMQRHLVNGAEHEFDPTVIDRYTDRVQLDEAISKYGYEAMIDDVILRLRRHPGNAEIANDPVKLRAVAKAWLDNAATQQDRIAPWAAHTLEHDSVARYAEQLRKAVPTLTEQQVNDIVWKTGPNPGEGNKPAKLRRQVRMDTAWENPSLETVNGRGFKLNNILIRNLEEIERMNSRYVNGRSAMAEVFRQFSTPDRVVESIPQLLDVLKEQAKAYGLNPAVMENDLRRIEYMSKLVMGIPTHQSTMFTRIGRMLRNASFMRVINTATGVRNFTELAGTIAENGLTATTKQLIPALDELFTRIRRGELDHEAVVTMQHMGIGVGDLTHRTLPTPEEGELVPKSNGFEYNLDKKLRVADRALQRGANLTSTLALVGPTQTALESTTFRLVAQRWMDMAQGKTPMLSEARLRAATLSPEMAKRIVAQLNLPGAVAFDKTAAGNVWHGFNFDKWTDVEAATALRQSIYKTVRRQVYQPHGSEMAQWMRSDMGKLFTQFRTFMLGSYESKTLFNLKMADRTAIMSMAAQIVSKAIAYYGITYLYSLAQPNREKYLKDRLDLSKVAKAAFSNAEFTSILPMAADTVQAIRGRQPMFAFARTTGLGDQPGLVGLYTSNPTADTIDKVARAVGMPLDKALQFASYQAGISRTWNPRITDRDVKNIQGGLPFQRMLGVDQFFRWLATQAPKERKP